MRKAETKPELGSESGPEPAPEPEPGPAHEPEPAPEPEPEPAPKPDPEQEFEFGPALAAMYARSEWQRTRGARRSLTVDQCYFEFGCVLTQGALRSALARDWNVRGPVSARGEIEDNVRFVEARAMGESSSAAASSEAFLSSAAFDFARIANLVRWSQSAGFFTVDEARQASDRLAVLAAATFDSWDAYGEHFLRGLRDHSASGIRTFDRAVAWLRESGESPWRKRPWPPAP